MYKLKPGIFFSLLVVAIIVAVTVPFKAFAAGQPQYVKIGLKTGVKGVAQCTLSSDTGFSLGFADEYGFTETLPLPAYKTIIASVLNGSVSLCDSDGVLLSADIGRNGCLMPASITDKGSVIIDNKGYRGGIILTVNAYGRLDIINYIDIEEYLYGVVHLEMSQGYPLEALKAQAVAARSFALMNLGRHRGEGYDLCSDTHCQVYGGISAEQERTNIAVDETEGLAIYWDMKPASANYHKNSGGHTQYASDVWTADQPYLVGKEDPYTPDYIWTATVHFDSLLQKLAQAGYSPGTIKSVAIKGRNNTGAVTDLLIAGEKGSVTLKKEQIRTVIGANIIRSRYFNMGKEYLGRTTGEMTDVTVSITDGKKTEEVKKNLYAVAAEGKLKSVENNDIYIFDGHQVFRPERSSHDGFDDGIIADSGKLILSGAGSGHGVGMSQDGAIEMARQGFTFIDILTFYYTGIEVK